MMLKSKGNLIQVEFAYLIRISKSFPQNSLNFADQNGTNLKLARTTANSLILNRISFFLFVVFAITLPFSIKLNSFVVILLTANFLLSTFIASGFSFKRNSFLIITFSSLFFIYVLAVLLSGNLEYGYLIEKKLGLLVFPLLLGSGSFQVDRKSFNFILGAFVLATLWAAIYTFKDNAAFLFRFSNIDLGPSLLILRPYFGLYVLFCVFILLYLIMQIRNIYGRIGLVLMLLFFAYFSFLIYAKMAILGCCVTLFGVVVFLFIDRKNYKGLFVFIACSLAAAFLLIQSSKTSQMILMKIIKFEPFELGNYQWIYYLSLNMRFAIWDCCWTLISESNHWLLGAGLGHQNDLNHCYYETYAIWTKHGVDLNADIVRHFPFNAHNEYLHIWLDLGIGGLLILLFVVIASLRWAIRRRNFLYFAFLLFFFLCCLTESMFSAQKGVVFYAFFNSLLAFQPTTS